VWQGYSGEYGVEPTNLVPNLLNYLAFATCCWAASSSPFISRHTALRLGTGILRRSPSRTMKPVNYRFRWARRAQHRGPSNRHGSMAESGPSYPVDILHGRKRKAAAQCLYYRHTLSSIGARMSGESYREALSPIINAPSGCDPFVRIELPA